MPSKAKYFHTSFLILHNYKRDNESHASELGAILELFHVKSRILFIYLYPFTNMQLLIET
jgi:hypothetical protein